MSSHIITILNVERTKIVHYAKLLGPFPPLTQNHCLFLSFVFICILYMIYTKDFLKALFLTGNPFNCLSGVLASLILTNANVALHHLPTMSFQTCISVFLYFGDQLADFITGEYYSVFIVVFKYLQIGFNLGQCEIMYTIFAPVWVSGFDREFLHPVEY